jgi:galactofuranosylgalactofuranosylrhamnosyl-N-acetylglucosaminyl-diphospho-decaprenol beta-1,5/1,6-galactofuranosyltransferase
VDQGNKRVSDHEQFAEAGAALGPKLRIIEQGNLGGSGGFSRAMMETAEKGVANYVLLLDDDVVCEPEGILRAVAFADLAKRPTIVGGHMFSLYARSVMHAYGEALARYRWFWGPAPNTFHSHDFGAQSLRRTKWLHRRVDVDYNGWWMCLIPTDVVRKVGLALPMFIKWDDAEFGLRAGEAGFPTVTLPGAAVWHVPWHEKDDTLDWQAYFHNRNRLISCLLHSPYDRGGSLIRELYLTSVKHAVSMQYSSAAMCLLALEDVLEGPQRMHRDVAERLPELMELRRGYSDSTPKSDLDGFPAPRRKKPPRHGKGPSEPTNKLTKLATLATATLRQLTPVDDLAQTHPQESVPHNDLRWWRLSHFDSALVSAADGSSAFWYRRDRKAFRDLMQRSMTLHARLVKEWPELSRRYKDALPELTSTEAWRRTFEQSTTKDS